MRADTLIESIQSLNHHVFMCCGVCRNAGGSKDDEEAATLGALDQVDGRLRASPGRHILGESQHTEALLVPQRHPHQLVPLPRVILSHHAAGESMGSFLSPFGLGCRKRGFKDKKKFIGVERICKLGRSRRFVLNFR